MSDVWTIPRIRQELDRLADWRGRLADALTAGATQLAAVGAVPEDALLTDLTDYRQRMRTLGFRITGATPAANEPLSLNRFDALLHKSQQCEELTLELAAIKDLEHVDDAEYPPLARCRSEFEHCCERLARSADPDDAEQAQLFQREHPLQAVLLLVDGSPTISDAEWNVLQDRVVEAYGRGFAAALIRGKIRRCGGASPAIEKRAAASTDQRNNVTAESVPLQSVANEIADASRPVTEDDGDHAVRWFQSGSSILPGMTATSTGAEPELATTETTGESEAEPAVPEPVIDLQLPSPVLHTGPAAQVAREIASESPHTAARLNALVQQLLRDGRIALAANLAECAMRLPSGRHRIPPAGLLRALALGTSLSYSRGELARAVEQELRPLLATTVTASIKDDVQYGTDFLLRAAALLPALLGASPAASAILRSFSIEPGLSQLYNYCHRVALFGERLQSQAVELFQAPAEQTQWLAERQQLQSEVRHWLDRVVARGVQYQRSSPLFLHAHWTVIASATQKFPQVVAEWAQWQEVLLHTHRLLRPIMDGSARRNDVHRELSRATALLETDSTRTTTGRVTPSLSSPMQDVLLEAVDLANRWLRLESTAPARGQQLAPQQAEELRSELLERAGGVLAELDVISRTRTNEFAQTGVACCRRVVESIRQLCAGETPLALHEPDARQVLYGEFLLMPHVELDEHWRPLGEPAEQEQAILEHLSAGWTDWMSAFALQCQQEDHVATARLLEMPVWSDPLVLRALHRVRGEELQRSRQSVLREIDGLASQVTLDRADDPVLDTARAEVHQRLERLRTAVSQVLTLGPIRRRLERCRDRWQRLAASDVVSAESAAAFAKEDSGVLLTASTTPDAPPPAAESSSTPESWVFLEE